jgi:NAD(P)-dependent dehydrogenase (short-subunit alcohol dehydrogenase family)
MRHVVIAGGGGVLGHALGQEFAAAGYVVSSLRRQRNVAAGEGDAVLTIACDLRDRAATRDALARAAAERGSVDVLVCNAAHLVVAPVAELAVNEFDESLRVGVGTAFHCVQAVLPSMLARGSGAILCSGATASMRGSARFAALAAAKFALRGFAQALARELQFRLLPPSTPKLANLAAKSMAPQSDCAQRCSTPPASRYNRGGAPTLWP